ncbi:MAG: hypothetical protein WCO56_24390 [Verrucomicrobiota bacterium]
MSDNRFMNAPIIAQYRWTPEDQDHVVQMIHAHTAFTGTDAVRLKLRRMIVLLLVIGVLVSAATIVADGWRPSVVVSCVAVILLTVSIPVLILLVLRFPRLLYLMKPRNRETTSVADREERFEFHAGGFTHISRATPDAAPGRMEKTWDEVERVMQTPHGFVLWLRPPPPAGNVQKPANFQGIVAVQTTPLLLFWLPRRSLTNPEAHDQFLRLVQPKLQAAG